MKLFLLRHAEAEPSGDSDHSRILTPKGIKQAARVGEFMFSHDLKPDLILSSPVLRARQTADILHNILAVELLEQPWLACGMTPDQAICELKTFAHFDSILLTGHEPDFSDLASNLLGMSRSRIHIRKASLTFIEVDTLTTGSGELQFSIPVRLM